VTLLLRCAQIIGQDLVDEARSGSANLDMSISGMSA